MWTDGRELGFPVKLLLGPELDSEILGFGLPGLVVSGEGDLFE